MNLRLFGYFFEGEEIFDVLGIMGGYIILGWFRGFCVWFCFYILIFMMRFMVYYVFFGKVKFICILVEFLGS